MRGQSEHRRVTRTLHQSLLMVTDLDASTAFYRDVVGLDPDAVEEGNVEFATGECTLVLESDFGEDILDAFGLDDPGDDRGRGVIVAVDVDNPDVVNEVHRRAEEADVDIRRAPINVDWGRRMALLTDPDGYVVEVSAPR